jgi:TolA-binding protein
MADEILTTGTENASSETSTEQTQAQTQDSDRVAELERQLAESEKKYGKLKSTMDVKLKELGDMTKRERERMTAEELERKEIEEIKAQNEMLLKEREVVNAEKRFIQHGCDADLASEGAKALIDKDYDALFGVIGKMLDNKAAFEKSELLKTMPKPQGGGSKATMTKEQFDRLSYKQRVELAEKDPETYRKFTA